MLFYLGVCKFPFLLKFPGRHRLHPYRGYLYEKIACFDTFYRLKLEEFASKSDQKYQDREIVLEDTEK